MPEKPSGKNWFQSIKLNIKHRIMRCKDYQKLLVQLPYEELSQEEKVLLEDHLKSCEKCTAELLSFQQLFKFTRKLSTSIPKDKNKINTIESILKEISNPPRISHQQIIGYRPLQIIINSAAIFLIGLFLFQQVQIKRNLKDLNVRIEIQNHSTSYNKSLNDIEIASYLGESKLLEQLEISEDEILDLINDYKSLQEEKSAILNYLQNNYPEVYKELQKKLNDNKFPTHKL